MKDTDWKIILKSIAPSLSAAMGGPMVGLAVKTLGEILLPQAERDEKIDMPQLGQRLLEVLNAPPEESQARLLALKKADRQFAIKMRTLDIDLEKLAGRDRADARNRQIMTGDIMPQILGGAVLFGFFITVAFVLQGGLRGVQADALTLIGTLIGYVSAKADQVIAYFFGSSSSSREKTRALAKAVDTRHTETGF